MASPRRTYYQVLGIRRDEQDPAVIEEAALRRSILLRPYQVSRESECMLRLNEIGLALSTLLDPARRRVYDQDLDECRLTAVQEGPSPQPMSTRQRTALDIRSVEEGACDVKLVYRDYTRQSVGHHET